MNRRTRAAAVLAALLVAAACGSDDPDDPTEGARTDTEVSDDPATEAPAFPVTITAANGDVEIAEEPTAIVSLAPTATEMLFAIGAGDQVEAVDDNSNFPADVPTTDLSGFEPNIEAIAGYEPDLVVVSNDPGALVAGLTGLGIPVLLLPAAVEVDDTYTQIEQLGAATGHVGEAAELVGQMQSDIEEIVADVPDTPEPLTYYHELDNTFFSVTSDTFVGRLYSLAGLENIADEADDGSGYPQLSAEYVIQSDPDLVFLADTKCCGQNAETLAQRPGWDQLTALQSGGVVELDDDIASRWGPRIVDLLRIAVERAAAVQPA